MINNEIKNAEPGANKVAPAIKFSDLEEFAEYSTSDDEDKTIYWENNHMKNGPSIDQRVVKMKVVQALSTSVKNKIIKGEFNNDFEGVFDNESDN